MHKVFVVVKTKAVEDMSATQVVAAFNSEAAAQNSAEKWTDSTTHAWVDEVSLYE